MTSSPDLLQKMHGIAISMEDLDIVEQNNNIEQLKEKLKQGLVV